MTIASWSDAQVLAQLNSGSKWSGSTITFAFPTTASGAYSGSDGEGLGFRAATAAQQTIFRLALQTWDDLITPNFQEITATTSNIEIAYTTHTSGYAHAFFPQNGSAWFNPTYTSGTNNLVSPTLGTHGFETFIHELGHALGLNHMGNYNGSGTWTPSSYQDSTVLTVMSYFGPSGPYRSPDILQADWVNAAGVSIDPQTPMLNDVMAIQTIYGASTTTRTGDTIYGFGCNITEVTQSIYDFAQNTSPVLTLYDAGGTDTLNLSGWSTPSTISLVAGTFSSADSMTNNIAIARNTTIENAVGGAGNDVITGNTANNRLDGGGGNDNLFGDVGDDTLIGGGGSDSLDGGDGSDTAIFTSTYATYTISFVAGTSTYSLADGTGAIDTAKNIEFFQFSDQTRSAATLMSSDLTPPTLLGVSPADNSTGVALDTNLTFTFSEAVQAGTGNLVIYNGNGTVARTIGVKDTTQVTFSGPTLTLNPSADFASGSDYYVLIGSGVVQDRAGNAYVGLSSPTAFNFSTRVVDTTAPTLLSTTPADNATDVPVGVNLVLTFSEPVQAGSGNILVYNGNGSLAKTIPVTDTAQVSFTGSTLTVNPSADLAAGSVYYVNLGSGVVKDYSGNSFAGIAGSTAFNFTTAAPSVTDDYPWSMSTNGVVIVGGGATSGVVNFVGDRDMFKVALTAGNAYQFDLARTSGGLADPYLTLYDGSGINLASDDNSGGSQNARISFVATASGTYYLGAADAGSGAGGYTLSAINTTDDYPYSTSTTGVVSIGGTSSGTINFIDDADLFKVSLTAGTMYVFELNRTAGGLPDPYLQLFDPSVNLVAEDDDGGGNLNSQIVYTPSVSGTFYLGAWDVGSGTGGYSITANKVVDDFPWATNTTGVVSVGGAGTGGVINYNGDADLFKVSLTAGTTYVIDLIRTTNGLTDPYLSVYDPSVTEVASDDDSGGALNAHLVYTPVVSGTFYLGAADAGTGKGGYTMSVAPIVDDFPSTMSTNGVVTVGGSATNGVINYKGDEDLFKVTLAAGSTYTFELLRTNGGLTDPYLELFGPTGSWITSDDDSAGTLNSRISYTPSASGVFFLNVSDYSSGTGGYALSAAKVDTIAPTLTTTSPLDNATGVAVGANLSLTFSESVRAGSGSIFIYNSNGTVARTIAVTDTTQVSFAGNTMTVNPAADLALGAGYYVNLAAGVVTDLSGNAFAGIFNDTTFNFTTTAAPADDYPLSTATTGVVTVGGAATPGVINYTDDGDAFKVNLVAGTSYQFDLVRTPGGLTDPYLQLYDANVTMVADDDDGGGALNSRIYFTSQTTDTFYLVAWDVFDGTGAYQLSAVVANDDFPWSVNTTATITPNAAARSGLINFPGDDDLFKLTLQGGTPYVFNMKAASGSAVNAYLTLLDGALTVLATDDNSGGGSDARIQFTPGVTGTYFLGASDFGSATGSYTVSAATSSGGTPTYTLTPGATSVNEGASVTFTVSTTNVAAGTTLNYLLTGVSAADVSGGLLAGSVQVDAAGGATFNVGLLADNLTEGPETLVATLTGTGGATLATAAGVTVVDTSVTPVLPTSSRTLVFIASGATEAFSAAVSGETVYGGASREVVTLLAGVSGVTLDQNIERFNLPGASSTYEFKQAGNRLQVFDGSGTTLLVVLPIQGDADGTQVGFANGTYDAKFSSGRLLIGGATVDATTPTALAPTTPTSTTEPAPAATSGAKAYMAATDIFTAANSGINVYGNNGIEVLTIAANTSGVRFDQNVDQVIFPGSESNYTFLQTGNQINVYDAAGTTMLARGPVQGDTDGTLLTFANGTGSVLISAGVMRLGGTVVSTTTPAPVVSSVFGGGTGNNVTVGSAGSSSAAGGNYTFTVSLGNYTYTIAGFGAGDKIVVPGGSPASLINDSFTDGAVTLQFTGAGQVANIVLTGLTNAQDGGLFGPTDLNTVFGAGTYG